MKSSIEATQKLGQGYAYLWDSLKSIDVIDDYTVKFTSATPEPLDVLLSSQYGAWIFSPAVADKPSSWFDQGNDAGTGPYTMKTYNPETQVILAAYPDYWGGWKDKQYKDVVVSVVPDTQTERQLLESGQADYQAQGSREDVGPDADEPGHPCGRAAELPELLDVPQHAKEAV